MLSGQCLTIGVWRGMCNASQFLDLYLGELKGNGGPSRDRTEDLLMMLTSAPFLLLFRFYQSNVFRYLLWVNGPGLNGIQEVTGSSPLA